MSTPAGPGPDLGRIGFVLALVAVALSLVQQVAFAFMPLVQADLGVSVSQLALAIGGYSVVHTALSIAALVLGLLGAQRRRSPVHSGIAIGVGGAGFLAGVVGLIVVPLVGFAL